MTQRLIDTGYDGISLTEFMLKHIYKQFYAVV